MNHTPKGRPSLRYELAGSGAHKADGATGPKVLVVDDDPDMTRLIGGALASSGFRWLAAYDALQGLLVAQREVPALIIVDLHMPAGGGLTLLEKLRASARTAGTPVLVVTADLASDLPEKAKALGARGLLHKPLDLARLVEMITPYISASAS